MQKTRRVLRSQNRQTQMASATAQLRNIIWNNLSKKREYLSMSFYKASITVIPNPIHLV